jgi:GT2 family glycosyltransferase
MENKRLNLTYDRGTDSKFCKNTGTPVLILVYDGWDMVINNLSTMSISLEDIWIIDNGSAVDMSATISNKFPKIKYFRLDNNYGWAGGYNRAIEHINAHGYDSVFILNSDAIIDAPSVNSAISGLDYNSRVAAVGSIILEYEGTFIAYDGNFHTTSPNKYSNEIFSNLKPAQYIHGAGFALSLSAYREIGPFYEPYFLYHEEVDWCSRARQKGYEIFVSGNSFCYHKGIASSTNANREYYVTRNAFLALKRKHALGGTPNSWLGLVVEGCNFFDNDRVLAAAHGDGLLDGIFGRFGQRHKSWNPILRSILIIIFKLLIIFPRILRKMRLIYF